MNKKLNEVTRMQQLAGILKEEVEEDNKSLANKYYNEWLKIYDASEDFGDSTTFSGSEDDIINRDGYRDDIDGIEGYSVDEVASVFISTDKDKIQDISKQFENSKIYQEGNKYIIIVW